MSGLCSCIALPRHTFITHSLRIMYRLVEMEIKAAEAEERAYKLTAASAKTRCGNHFLVIR